MNSLTIKNLPSLHNVTVAVIGLGYVGLPLAMEIAKCKKCLLTGELINRRVLGFDINNDRIDQLINGYDLTNEFSEQEIKSVESIIFTSNEELLLEADVFIVTVPTPIDDKNLPNIKSLEKATNLLLEVLLKRNSNNLKLENRCAPIFIYESTVYPGLTEFLCKDIIEKNTDYKINNDFSIGYSPERINPSDKKYKLINIMKVTSGSNEATAKWINNFYGSFITAGTFLAASIKVAESAKVIENTQRDVNIALINELAQIFEKDGIDTLEVLEAAKTKWNFLPFNPGLVGGHCIGVDPYYLTYYANKLGYEASLIKQARNINNNMSDWISAQVIRKLKDNFLNIESAKILVLGITFKENCPDIRNSGVVKLVNKLSCYGLNIDIIDNIVDKMLAKKEYGLDIYSEINYTKKYNAIIGAVAHSEFKTIDSEKIKCLLMKNGFVYDIKGIFPREINAFRV